MLLCDGDTTSSAARPLYAGLTTILSLVGFSSFSTLQAVCQDKLDCRVKVVVRWLGLMRNRASYLGYRIILRQVSPESESIFDFILSLYESCSGDWKKLQQEARISDTTLLYFLEYAAQFLGNAGNYKGFGDSKFIPRCSPEDIALLASSSSKSQQLLESSGISSSMFASTDKPTLMHLGFPNLGHQSAYYPESPDLSQEEIKAVDDCLGSKELLHENTRIRKTRDANYEVLIASALQHPPPEGSDAGKDTEWIMDGKFQGRRLTLVFGDYIEELAKVALHLKKAGLNASNDTEKRMMDEFAKSFGTGSMNAYKEAQKLWVKDIGPMVESNIGFIEAYRDPAGVRSEWEGMGKRDVFTSLALANAAVVAMVNQERTAAL